MLESVTADSVFAEILMEEPEPKAVLLVEGPDEGAALYGHLQAGVLRIICGGKATVVGAAAIAQAQGVTSVYGLIDRDLDALRDMDGGYPEHVIATDAYDLAADLLLTSSESLRRILSAHAPGPVEVIEATTGRTVDDAVYDLTIKMAGIRLAALRERFPFVLKNFDFGAVVGPDFQAAEVGDFLGKLRLSDPNFFVGASVEAAVMLAASEVRTSRHHCGGHDIVGASVALIHRAGGPGVSKRAIAGSVLSLATCQVLASLNCLQQLAAIAHEESGVELLDCIAA